MKHFVPAGTPGGSGSAPLAVNTLRALTFDPLLFPKLMSFAFRMSLATEGMIQTVWNEPITFAFEFCLMRIWPPLSALTTGVMCRSSGFFGLKMRTTSVPVSEMRWSSALSVML